MTQPNPATEIRSGHAGVDALTEHARWIISTHTARADGLQQRAMGFLGVVGVMLGLVLTALTIGTARHLSVQLLTVGTVVALLASSVEFARCLWVVTVSVPSVDEARARWRDYSTQQITDDRVRVLIANDLLGGRPDRAAPPTTAKADADSRARRLKSGLRCLSAAFLLLASLIITMLFQ